MSVVPWPDHLLTLDEWDALPEDNSRHYELIEGTLSVTPRPAPLHQWAIARLSGQLNRQLPDDLVALQEVEVLVEAVHPATVRPPDIVVTSARHLSGSSPRLRVTDVLLAVEVISPGSRRTDQVTKFAEYAEAGIEHYWLVDLDAPVTISAYRLVDGEYEVVADTEQAFTLSEPVPLEVDPRQLTTRR